MFRKADLLVDGRHGIYCPQAFAETVDREMLPSVSDADWQVLLDGPDNELYWEVWTEVDGTETADGATIYQDGDIWAVYEWEDEE